MKELNIFQKFALVGKISAAVKEVKALKEANSEVVDKIVEIINDLMGILDKIKAIAPKVGELVEAIIDLVKKILGK